LITRKLRQCVLLGLLIASRMIFSQVREPSASTGQHPASGSLTGSAAKLPEFPNVLYGVAYYNEYLPYDRLDADVALMKQAGISVVRMGESTWSLWEPEDGRFEYAWMDRVVDAMGKAGIKVIMGTPTYSIPPWMYKAHPEILARPLGGAAVFYGMRQNMDTDNATFRFYAERVIHNLVEHYRDNPVVIGWQIDNETSSYGASNPDVFAGFVDHLKGKFSIPEDLNKAWFLNYWGQDIHRWDELPTRDSAQSTGYKLEWSRWQQIRVTNYLSWQAGLVRQYRRPDQFVTHDFAGAMHREINEFEIAKSLDIAATNNYHGTQENMGGDSQSLTGDYIRSLTHRNYLITETNAQTTDWTSEWQFPPYDGQLRQDVYTHLSNGANMVEYWHWHSIHSGQETYWKGVLSHDLEPNRAYAEVSRTAHELQRIGPHLVDLKITNQVAILYSSDSANALDFMPFAHGSDPQWTFGPPAADYGTLISQIHQLLYKLNIGTDFVFPEDPDFSKYKVLIVPALYVADDALLTKISDYVKHGGHVLMTFKSGFCNEDSAVRWVRAPGPLRDAAGFSYQEFSNLNNPISLKGDPYHVGDENKVLYWAEFLMPEHAQPIAYYDHPFFGRWPAITRNQFGSGTLTYEGTWLSEKLQTAVVSQVLGLAGMLGSDQTLSSNVRVRHGVNRLGKTIHYYFNYSSVAARVPYSYATGTELTSDKSLVHGTLLSIAPWDLAIIEEK
jgi:beta-galactosidase